MVKFITKSVCMALVAVLCVGGLNAQELLPKKSASLVAALSQDDATAVKTNPLTLKGQTRDDLLLKYINGDLAYVIGNTNYVIGTTYYFSGCISFTAGQMASYVGGTLHTVSMAIPQEQYVAGWTSCKVWVKGSLSGAVVYEQEFTPTLGTVTDVLLDEPQELTEGAYVIGYTVTITAEAETLRPLWCSDGAEDPYQPGGFNYIISQSATSYGSGASWNTFTTQGNLSIIGYVSGATLPENDLAVTLIKSDALKWVGNPAPYTVTVQNAGTASQNNFTVQVIDASDAIVASQTITTALASGSSTNVNFNYTPTTPGILEVRGKVVLEGDENPTNDISDPIIQRIYPEEPMTYCTAYTLINGIGPTTPPVTGHAAISYTAANMADYAGKTLTAIDMGIGGGTVSNGVVWIRNARDGSNLYSQNFTPVEGWNFIELDEPYTLTNDNTFIGYSISITDGHPLGIGSGSQVSGVNHVGINTTWYDLPATGVTTGNMAIIGAIKGDCDPPENVEVAYTEDCVAKLTWDPPTGKDDVLYNVYRDGTAIATEIAETFFDDEDFNEYNPHTWCVETICENSSSMKACKYMEECNPNDPPPCNPVKDLKVEFGNSSSCAAVLTWNHPDELPNATYNIYRGITKIASDWPETEYIDEDINANVDYVWVVRTVCLEGESTSASTSGKCIPIGINELSNSVAIYPNPTSGTITITADNFSKVEIYNTVGQLIETKTVDTFVIASYNTGIYFFKVYDVYNNNVTKRVMVAK